MKVTNIKVDFIDCMGSDDTVANAARVSFDKLAENYTKEENSKLIKYLAKHDHWSPFSHAFISFRVKAPIFVARQLGKSVVGLSWNEVSRRYVSTEPEFYMPKNWRKAAENVKQGSSDETIENLNFNGRMDDSQRIEDHVERVCMHSLTVYERMLESGVCAEQARMILPQNTMTEWIWSGSLYAFARVCNLRLDSHTQLETQTVAKLIDSYMEDLFPESWKVLVK